MFLLQFWRRNSGWNVQNVTEMALYILMQGQVVMNVAIAVGNPKGTIVCQLLNQPMQLNWERGCLRELVGNALDVAIMSTQVVPTDRPHLVVQQVETISG